MRLGWSMMLLVACKGGDGGSRPGGQDDSGDPDAFSFADPGAMPALRGPGGPVVAFEESALWTNCARLHGDEDKDREHHNLIVPYRGHLVLPWSPEWGSGGLSFFEMDDPCNPVKVGEGWDQYMRESHALGFLHLPEGDPHAGDYAVTTGALGILIWDITDLSNPHVLQYLQLPDVFYPDAYARVVLSVSWQYPWLYVGVADNGVYVVDTTDPAAPVMVGEYSFDPVLRVGGVFAMGNLLFVSSAEGSRAALLDISTPENPQPVPGGLFQAVDGEGNAWEAYHANLAGDLALFARKEGSGGLMVMDISNPQSPTYAADISLQGNGGYVFYDEGFAFTGESDIARVYDLRSLPEISVVGEAFLPGDLDTFTPFGNVGVLSVDEDAEEGIASAVVPWTTEPDTAAPEVMRIVPADGEAGVALSGRVGVVFNEMVESSSVFPGSIRLWDEDGNPVDGWGSAQENIASYVPKEPLQPGMTYTVEVMAGGIMDVNGNRVGETVSSTFTTAGGR